MMSFGGHIKFDRHIRHLSRDIKGGSCTNKFER